jgi:hypothetical protein
MGGDGTVPLLFFFRDQDGNQRMVLEARWLRPASVSRDRPLVGGRGVASSRSGLVCRTASHPYPVAAARDPKAALRLRAATPTCRMSSGPEAG